MKCIKSFQFWVLFSWHGFSSFLSSRWMGSFTEFTKRFSRMEVAFLWAKNILKCCYSRAQTCQVFLFLLSCSHLVLTWKIYCVMTLEKGNLFQQNILYCVLRFSKCLCCVPVFSSQVGEIIKIMKAYINMIVKKRCSVKSATSVDSHASIWTRWCRWTGTSLVMGICNLPAQV